MAIKKAEAIDQFPARYEADVVALENQIDDAIKAHYLGEGGHIFLPISHFICLAIRREITRRYTEAGWTIVFKDDDHTSGSWIELS